MTSHSRGGQHHQSKSHRLRRGDLCGVVHVPYAHFIQSRKVPDCFFFHVSQITPNEYRSTFFDGPTEKKFQV